MFDNYCPECDKRQLVFPSQIRSLTNTNPGIEVHYTCWCGSQQTWRTGTLLAA